MNQIKPKVSTILTSYNHEKFIRDSIDSVLNQTFTDFELIIWDDGSIDNSWDIISSYSDPRIKSFRNEINHRGGNLKRAIQEKALGEYIAVHHSDDLWEHKKLEKQVEIIENQTELGAIFTHVNLIDENGQPFDDIHHPYYGKFDQPNRSRHEWLRHFFYHGNALCHPSALIRKACYDEEIYRNGFSQLADFDLWVRLCMRYPIHIIQEKLTSFRVNREETSASGNRPQTRIRLQFELGQVINHYRTIPTIEDLVLIFPEASEYLGGSYEDLLYALGRVAVDTGTIKPTQLFGLNLLFEALNDPFRATQLKEYHGFSKKEFVALTAKYDVFSVEELELLSQEIKSLRNPSFLDALKRLWHVIKS
jgi:glycosyltransferase involved in cell wall biosynthesis